MSVKIPIFVFAVLALVSLAFGKVGLSKPVTEGQKETVWRIVSSEKQSGWGDAWEGGEYWENLTNYYDNISPERPDSTSITTYGSSSSGGDYNGSSLHVYTYTQYPEYVQVETFVSDLIYPQYSYRMIDRYDTQNRLLLHIQYRYATPDSPEYDKDQYLYDAAGNLLEKVEWGSYPQPYGPKKVTRNTYRQDCQPLSQDTYNVIGNDLNNLIVTRSEDWFYNSENRIVARIVVNNSQHFYKYLYSYNPQGLEAQSKQYYSSDSLSWQLETTLETTYGVSFGELKPFRIDQYHHSYSDSTSFSLQQYSLYTYLDENRDIQISTYIAYDNTRYEHTIFNSAMKLTYHRISTDSQGYSDYSYETYVWDSFVQNSDTVIPVNEIKLDVYPNPFNRSTNIAFELVEHGKVKLELYNIRGQKIANIYEGAKPAGIHNIDLTSSSFDNGSGVYLLRLSSNGGTISKKIIYIK